MIAYIQSMSDGDFRSEELYYKNFDKELSNNILQDRGDNQKP